MERGRGRRLLKSQHEENVHGYEYMRSLTARVSALYVYHVSSISPVDAFVLYTRGFSCLLAGWGYQRRCGWVSAEIGTGLVVPNGRRFSVSTLGSTRAISWRAHQCCYP